ncbi:unnamed protein product [Brugia pahangi]|uniref:Uncharacterized protein n=1 Tax=Brugia pahangi TaxID=6280 RepID=A0A0N4TLK6_BRUPA|nr:unnamed protein product [Brugia pahangi]
MGTISAMIIICCLIISAALTVVIILVTIPTEITYESHYPKAWVNRENTHFNTAIANNFNFHPNKKILSNLKNDTLSVIITTTDTITTTTTTTTIITTIINATDFIIIPNTAKILKVKLENDKHSYQSFLSSTIIPMKNWKWNKKQQSSQRRTTVNLSTNIIIGNDKNNHKSSIKSTTNQLASKNSRQNLATLMLHNHIEQLSLNDNKLARSKQDKMNVTQMTLLREITFSNDVKVVGLTMQRTLLYVATSDGQIMMINPETSRQV